MYGVNSIGPQVKNPFETQKPGTKETDGNNPFAANKLNEDGAGYDPAKLFASNTVGINNGASQERQQRTLAIA